MTRRRHDTATTSAPLPGVQIFEELNCSGCHARDQATGMRGRLDEAVMLALGSKVHPDAIVPPSLTSVGDKLTPDKLHRAIQRLDPPRRPWLTVRMPRFSLRDSERTALVEFLIQADRIPSRPSSDKSVDADPLTRRLAGSRLVTSDGFGCVSCHKIGTVQPTRVEPGVRGPDLSMLSHEIRRPWFDRFLRNPARMTTSLEMPSIQTAVRGVLDDRLDHQLSALWDTLNQTGFEPPRPGAIRTVRQTGSDGQQESAIVMTDVLRADALTYTKPFYISLPNRHNVLYDLETARLASWSVGDAARQRTDGKTWYWEVAGEPIARASGDESELTLGMSEQVVKPRRQGQFVTEFDWLQHVAGGVRMRHRVTFAGDTQKPVTLGLIQTWTAAER